VRGHGFRLDEGVKAVMFAVVSAAVQGVLCGDDDFLHGVSLECLPQCPQGLVGMTCASSSRTILKLISFEQSHGFVLSCVVLLTVYEMNHLHCLTNS
jgi:hypothetical protein